MKAEQHYAIGAAKQRREFIKIVEEVKKEFNHQSPQVQYWAEFVCNVIIERIKQRRRK